MKEWRLLYSETTRLQIANLHPEIKSIIRTKLNMLRKEPFAGKPLERELSGYRSLYAKRYRIIYKVDEDTKTLAIHHVGHRRDIYELFSERAGHL